MPLFFIALAIAEAEEGALSARGALELVAEEIGWGLIGGVAAGAFGAVALRTAQRRGLAEASGTVHETGTPARAQRRPKREKSDADADLGDEVLDRR